MPKTLLAVDDSATMRKVLEITFGGEDFRVVTADGTAGALAQPERGAAAVVIDTSLGGDDGYALAKEVRSRDGAGRHRPAREPLHAVRREPRQGRRGRRLHRQAVRHAGAHRQGEEGHRRARGRQGRGRRRARPRHRRLRSRPSCRRLPRLRRRRMSSRPSARRRDPRSSHRPPRARRSRRSARTRSPSRARPARRLLSRRSPRLRRSRSPRSRAPRRPASPRARRPRRAPRAPPHDRVPRARASRPSRRAPTRAPTPRRSRRPSMASSPASSATSGCLLAGRGRAGLSREVVERVVWEVVPQLAETIIKEELARLTKE